MPLNPIGTFALIAYVPHEKGTMDRCSKGPSLGFFLKPCQPFEDYARGNENANRRGPSTRDASRYDITL